MTIKKKNANLKIINSKKRNKKKSKERKKQGKVIILLKRKKEMRFYLNLTKTRENFPF